MGNDNGQVSTYRHKKYHIDHALVEINLHNVQNPANRRRPILFLLPLLSRFNALYIDERLQTVYDVH